MSSKPLYSAIHETQLMTEMWDPAIADNPEAFVMFAFPWGKAGTPLENFHGPRTWQRDELQAITEHIKNNKILMQRGQTPLVYQSATASGRGIGKSALVAWLNLWMLSTRIGSTSINAANSETQLKSRTWAEVGKWHTLAMNRHWFEINTMSLKPELWFEKELKSQLNVDTGYYYAQAQLWSEDNPDAFAGVHNHNGVLLIYDEASGIPTPIWEVSKGFFTDPVPNRFWFVFSNPRRNTGAFFECFGRNRKYWRGIQIDSRTVEGTDKGYLNQIVESNGEDSDEARVEVKGQFPRQGDCQFISSSIVDLAVERQLETDPHAALLMGVDVARFGDDESVIRFRQGRDARSIPSIVMKGADNMQLANQCADMIDKYNPDAVFIDAGNGTGVIDRLRERGYKVHEVWFGSASDQKEYFNKRTEMWARMREWLGGGCIDQKAELLDDLKGPMYKIMGRSDQTMLESKEEMKKRGLASPDHGDALAVTFFAKISRRDTPTSRNSSNRSRTMATGMDYNPLS